MSGRARQWRRFQGQALFYYSRLVAKTARFRVEGWDHFTKARHGGHPLLWTFWHGQLMPFILFGDRHLNAEEFTVVMVGDERGDTLGTFASRLGGQSVRVDMGGNPVAAGRAVLRVIQAMRAGKQSVIAPDGPDGPAFVPKPGVAFLARKAQATILPVGVWTRQAYQLRRWDSYLVPLPFARVNVTVGKPLELSSDTGEERMLRQITASLHDARYRAQVMAGIRPWP